MGMDADDDDRARKMNRPGRSYRLSSQRIERRLTRVVGMGRCSRASRGGALAALGALGALGALR